MQIASETVNCVSERGRECEHENGLCADAADVARVCVWRANTELNPSFTRGTHENYAISRDFKKELILPFLVLKPIFFGAVGSQQSPIILYKITYLNTIDGEVSNRYKMRCTSL